MANINRDYIVRVDVRTGKVTTPKIKFKNVDKSTSNIYVQLVIKETPYKLPVLVEEIENLAVSATIIKPNKAYKTVQAVLVDSIEGRLFELNLPDDCINLSGTYKVELAITGFVDGEVEQTTADVFTYTVEKSLQNELDPSIQDSEDLPVLKQLIEDMESAGGFKPKVNVNGTIIDSVQGVVKIPDYDTKSVTQAAIKELEDARVDVDGTTHIKLGNRLNKVDSQIKDKVNYSKTKTLINNYTACLKPINIGTVNYPINIYGDENGNYITDFDVSKYKHSGGNTWYVSKNGLQTNDGLTRDTPLESFIHAIDKSNSGDTIVFLDGIYTRGQALSSRFINKNLNIIGDGNVILKNGDDHVFTNHQGDVYYTTRSNVANVVYSFDNFKSTVEFKEKNTLSEVEKTPLSWVQDGNTIYFHMPKNIVPSNDNLILLLITGLPMIQIDCANSNIETYMENITIIGGDDSCAKFRNSTSNLNPKTYLKNCRFLYATAESGTSNCLSILGGTAFLQNCEAAYSQRSDGFNYRASNSYAPKVIEVNCIGHDNGFSADFPNCNGSTIHDGGKILRINGVYYNNNGGNVADVHENTESRNYECITFNSKGNITSGEMYNTGFCAQQAGTTMYCYSCKSFGNKVDGYAITGTTLNMYDCNFDSIGGDGTLNID